MHLAPEAEYRAYDIDSEEVAFLQNVFSLIAPQAKMHVELGDILSDRFAYADVTLFLKLLPVLEHEKKGSSLGVLKKQQCKHLVVSFPRESIGGREVGMTDFYRNWFRELITPESWDAEELLFPNEIVFVIRKY
jgi:16S rRNA (guanine(1405)-N(7))-methyltransferase